MFINSYFYQYAPIISVTVINLNNQQNRNKIETKSKKTTTKPKMTTTELRATIPRIIAKIDQDDFTEALKIAESNSKVSHKIYPIRAYIMYKLTQYQKVLDLYKSAHASVQKDLGMMHIVAQSYYKIGLKSGNFGDCINMYQLIGETYPEQSYSSAEYISNALAAYVNGNNLQKAQNLLKQVNFEALIATPEQSNDLITYESLFNASFVPMVSNQHQNALNLAQKAYTKFQLESGQDADPTEEGLLQYQIAYIQQLQGDNKSYQSTIETLMLDYDTFSAPMKVILDINSTLNKLQNASLTNVQTHGGEKVPNLIKNIETIRDENFEKMSKIQQNMVNFNLSLLSTLNKTIDHTTKLISSIPTNPTEYLNFQTNKNQNVPFLSLPSLQTPEKSINYHKEWLITTLSLYVALKERDYIKCDEILKKFEKSSISPFFSTTPQQQTTPTPAQIQSTSPIMPYYINFYLTKVYIALYRHQTSQAIAILTEFSQNKHINAFLGLDLSTTPAIMALFVTLYEDSQDYTNCTIVINKAIEFYQKKSKNNQNTAIMTQLRIKNATIQASSGDYKGAIASLEQLANQCDKNDKSQNGGSEQYYNFIAQIVTICAAHYPELVYKYTELIPDIDIDDNVTFDAFSLKIVNEKTNKMGKINIKNNNPSQDEQQFLPNGKHKYSAEKLASVRLQKRKNRSKKPLLPKNVTLEQYRIAYQNNFIDAKIDPYRWKPKWERPQVAGKGKKGQLGQKQLGKGPQGSGISENKVESTVKQVSTADSNKAKVQEALKQQKGKKAGRR
jgi:hypothetical protein